MSKIMIVIKTPKILAKLTLISQVNAHADGSQVNAHTDGSQVNAHTDGSQVNAHTDGNEFESSSLIEPH